MSRVEVIEQCRVLVKAGINYFILVVRDEEMLRLLAREVVSAFAGETLGPEG